MTSGKALTAAILGVALAGGTIALLLRNKNKPSGNDNDVETNSQEKVISTGSQYVKLPGKYQFGVYFKREANQSGSIVFSNRDGCISDTDMLIELDDRHIQCYQWNGDSYQDMGFMDWNIPANATLHIQIDNGNLSVTWMSEDGPINVLSAMPSVLFSNKLVGPYQSMRVTGGYIGA